MAVHEQVESVDIWWFPRHFCQSRFGEHRDSGTNSCTLISLLLADKISKEESFQSEGVLLPRRAAEIFGDAMNEGNRVYHRTFSAELSSTSSLSGGKGRTPNLSIPEAITILDGQGGLDFQLKEWFYTHLTASPAKPTYSQSVSSRLAEILRVGVQLYRQPGANARARLLFAALIADSRTTVFVFELPSKMVSFFDSHQHGHQWGAVVAHCPMDRVADLTLWYVKMLDSVYSSQPSVYEISFLTTSDDAVGLQSPHED